MAGRSRGRAVARPLLPFGLHVAGVDRRHRLPEQGRDLRHPVQGLRRDDDHDRGRSQTPGRADRRDFGAAHLGSALTHHPHVHMIAPGGGISLDGEKWATCRPGFFLPIRVLSRLFRRLFLEKLVAAHAAGKLEFFGARANLADPTAFAQYLSPSRAVEWVVYAKRPFGGPEAVLAYVSRYTHRVAISNSRLLTCDNAGVAFRYKDYRVDGL